jgi:hypothetical protein
MKLLKATPKLAYGKCASDDAYEKTVEIREFINLLFIMIPFLIPRLKNRMNNPHY